MQELEEGDKYWLETEKGRCALCQVEETTLNHLIEQCVATPSPSRRGCVRKNKREVGGIVKRLGKEDENKNNRGVE